MGRPLALSQSSATLRKLAGKLLSAGPLKPVKRLCMPLIKDRNLWDDFYREFELRFRGDPEELTCRTRKLYGPLLKEHFQGISGKGRSALDLGCGHGEFLRILQETGFDALGVDHSPVAVHHSRTGGLNAVKGDILKFLRTCPDRSRALISCTHVIEHCPPEFNFKLVRESYRCLMPGGLLILETPSLFSLWAGCRQFYLDPTHKTPVHPDYIRFLCEYNGFTRTEIKEFGEVKHPLRGEESERETSLTKKWDQWLFGPMDLCCLAYRPD